MKGATVLLTIAATTLFLCVVSAQVAIRETNQRWEARWAERSEMISTCRQEKWKQRQEILELQRKLELGKKGMW